MVRSLMLTCAGLSGLALAISQPFQDAPPPLLATSLQPLRLPFVPGESVRYEVNWKPLFLIPAFKAGELRLELNQTYFQNQKVFKISAWFRSEGALKSVTGFDIQDYFESMIDGNNFRSLRFLHQIRRNQKKRDLEVLFDYRSGKALVEEKDVSVNPPRRLHKQALPGLSQPVVDTLSVFYVTRLRQLRKGDQYRIHLSDTGRVKEVDIVVGEKEQLTVPLGRYQTYRVSTQEGIFKGGGDFRIWYSSGQERFPIKFEADVRFGKVYGHLIHVQTPSWSRTRITVP